MLDLRLIRHDPDAVRAALARRGDAERLDRVLELDGEWREATTRAESLRAEQKRASGEIAAAKRSGDRADALLERMGALSREVKELGERARAADEALRAELAALPNLPDPTAAAEDEVVREVGAIRLREGRDHLELAGERIDLEHGARVAGSRFAYLRGEMVLL